MIDTRLTHEIRPAIVDDLGLPPALRVLTEGFQLGRSFPSRSRGSCRFGPLRIVSAPGRGTDLIITVPKEG